MENYEIVIWVIGGIAIILVLVVGAVGMGQKTHDKVPFGPDWGKSKQSPPKIYHDSVSSPERRGPGTPTGKANTTKT